MRLRLTWTSHNWRCSYCLHVEGNSLDLSSNGWVKRTSSKHCGIKKNSEKHEKLNEEVGKGIYSHPNHTVPRTIHPENSSAASHLWREEKTKALRHECGQIWTTASITVKEAKLLGDLHEASLLMAKCWTRCGFQINNEISARKKYLWEKQLPIWFSLKRVCKFFALLNRETGLVSSSFCLQLCV